MNWRSKSRIQNVVARLPPALAHPLYYFIQRHFGALQSINPVVGLQYGVTMRDRICQASGSSIEGTFVEIGTGRRVNVPLALWLMGAERVVTVDLHPYLKEVLVKEDIAYIKKHPGEVIDLFGDRLKSNRMNRLLDLAGSDWRLNDLLSLTKVTYTAPCDASKMSATSGSVDFHVSVNVLQHIPKPVLQSILKEGNRIIKSDGLFVHRIDYADMFSYWDSSVSAVNFLQYSDSEWDKIAGNKFMYMNRLRVDDFLRLFAEIGHEIVAHEQTIDETVSRLLESNEIVLDKKFRGKSAEAITVTSSWIVSKHGE